MRSLRAKLIAPFVMGTLVLTLLLAWYTYTSARKAVEDAILLVSEAKTNNASSSMALLFRSISAALQNMVVDPHVTALFSTAKNTEELRAQTADWLETIAQGNDYYRDILIVDKDGICIASSNPSHLGLSYLGKPQVLQALSGRFNFGETSVGRVTKKFSTMAAGPIDAGGTIMGALIIACDLPKIVDYDAKTTHDTQTIFTAMLAPDGIFMVHKDMALMANANMRLPALYTQLAAAGEKGDAVQYDLRGETYIGYAKKESFSEWVVVTSGTTREVFAPAYRVGIVVFCISFAFLCAISFAVIRFANGILSTLLSLIQYAKRVSEGDLDLELAPTHRTDELGILHTALHRLVGSLQSMLVATREASNMKGQFLANMSHEIRTPLNAIIGMAHLCLRDGSMQGKERGYLDKIQLAARSLLGIINDILDISKVEAGMLLMENVRFNLRETIANILDIHRENARQKDLDLLLRYPEGLPEYFIGDPLRIGQIVTNLLSNALKFTPKGSVTVECRLEETEEDDKTKIMRISVTDTGIGIAEETIASLFQPFTQADASITRKFGGTGLGLAISDRLVHLLGGAFTVSSAPGTGTTFSFTLHLEHDKEGQQRIEHELPLDTAFEQLKLTGKRILVAEDNEINQIIIEELIAPSGASVTLASNGLEAVDAVRTGSFDLVLMDMQMPLMGGLEATLAIRALEQGKHLPIIAVTANAMKEDQDKGFASGMNDYLTKPVEPLHLLQILRTWLS